MKQDNAITCLTAIAHEGRLSLVRRLIQAGPQGMASGDLARAEHINTTTASAQLLVLSRSGLIKARREGKRQIYTADYDRFQKLITFLMEDCCAGMTQSGGVADER